MRILIIGKLPPIQGATSVNTYNLVKSLARDSITVDVITNALEVTKGYKTNVLLNELDLDQHEYNENINIFHTTPLNKSYIPNAKGFTSRMFGIGTGLCIKNDYDYIIGWYFQPYSLVATLLAKIYNKPVINLHAGSDITTIFSNKDYNHSITWTIKNSTYLLSSNHKNIRSIFSELKVEDKVVEFCHTPISDEFYRLPKTFCLQNLKLSTIEHYTDYFEKGILQKLANINDCVFQKEAKTILIYGKIGKYKATLSLLEAFNKVSKTLNVIWIPTGGKNDLQKLITYIAKVNCGNANICVLRPLDNSLIPSLIDASDLVVYLENNFPVNIHTPKIPREVLLRKKAFMCSEEILKNTPIYGNLKNGTNSIIVSQPNNAEELLSHFEAVIDNTYKLNDIGQMGYIQVAIWEKALSSKPSIIDAINKIINV